MASSSCGDKPVAPHDQPRYTLPRFSSGPPPILLGVDTIPTQATNAPNNATAPWQSTGISIAANTWNLVTFRGSIAVSKNYQCDTDFATVCSSPLAGQSAPPKGIAAQKYLSDSVRISLASGAFTSGTLSHDDSTSWAVINSWWDGGVQVKRHGIVGSNACTSTPDPNGPPTNCPRQGLSEPLWEAGWYLLAGSHTVTVEKIFPLYLDPSSDTIPSATSVTLDAEKHPKVPIAVSQWYFRNDDTTATPMFENPATPFSGGAYVGACAFQLTCTYTPARSGRMYVHGSWQSKHARGSALVIVN